MKRIPSIDIARDHTRDFLLTDALIQSPTNMATTTPLLFFTRWITHLCAPSFVFLSGISAYISLKNGQDLRAGRRFLLSRGIWLLILEFTLIGFGLSFDVRFRMFLFEVIATIGSGFILLSFLSRFPPKALLITGLILIFGHDLISFAPMPTNTALQFFGSLLFGPGAFPISPNLLFVVAYPILPWLGIMLTGFAAGRLFERPASDRKRLLRRIGLASLGLFLLLRGANIYGDPSRWSVQKNDIFTVLSFLNVTKYAPSLLFTLCMLGILLLVLSELEGRDNVLTRGLSVYGRAPLFYFIIHMYLIHLIMFILVLAQGYTLSGLVFANFKQGRPKDSWGLSLAYIYPIWIGVVALLFPPGKEMVAVPLTTL